MCGRPAGSFARARPGRPSTSRRFARNDLVFCSGPAGTGKTYLAVATAVESLKQKQIGKIVLVRPAVEAGENLGFLPGDMQAKINPYLRPLLDALREMMDYEQVKRYMADDVIEVVPLAYMRGRTLNNAFIIMDEAQNTTVPQMKMFLTRMGLQSKVVVSGDTSQVDLPPHTKSGLIDAIGRLRHIEGFANVDARQAKTSCGTAWCRKSFAPTRRARRRSVRWQGAWSMEHGVRMILRLHAPRSALLRFGITMSTGSKKKRRIDRVTSVELPPGVLGNLWGHLRRGHVLVRLALCARDGRAAVGDHARLGAAAAISLGRRAAARYRRPHRIRARRPEATRKARELARSLAIATYDHDPAQLEQLRAKVENEVTELVAAKSFDEVDDAVGAVSACRSPKARRSRRPRSASSSFRSFAKRSPPKARSTRSRPR